MAPYILVQVICLDSVILFEMYNVLTLIHCLAMILFLCLEYVASDTGENFIDRQCLST